MSCSLTEAKNKAILTLSFTHGKFIPLFIHFFLIGIIIFLSSISAWSENKITEKFAVRILSGEDEVMEYKGASSQETDQIDKHSISFSIYFASNSDVVDKKSYDTINAIGSMMVSDSLKKFKFLIIGHTDSEGLDQYNMELSKKRSKRVKEFLITYFNILPERIIAKGEGDTKPLHSNDTEEGRAKNRRVEVIRLD